ncbi:hypothetical protein AG1IA_06201 [Rhizoctonia solani AG-1 IA]|uniref:Uncharacterized protein n=2 Tax=Rhizoctonia solani TaxID=456999 RepID=L8WSS5_THACA|nr:hypothetical protein AG1IA_06201 [Rhizoctonia solani AG-1 IA]
MDRTTGKNPRSRAWISFWYIASAFVIAWDVGYCFMRPRSMAGGDLHWIWKPYALYLTYIAFGQVYGWPSFTRGDGFANAQCELDINTFEFELIEFDNSIDECSRWGLHGIVMEQLAYVYYVHIRPSSVAPLVGFSSESRINTIAVQFNLILTCSAACKFQIMMNDYRTVLYRLDLATSYPTLHALLQHFMNESPLDGTLELRVVTTPSTGSPHIPTPPRSPNPHAPHAMMSAPEHYMSFARSDDGREVHARHTFGVPPDPDLNVSPSSPTQRSIYARKPMMAVTHEFPPKTSVIAAFIPIVEHFLRTDHELASVIFECRSYMQPAERGEVHPLEILDRQAPYKRMFGYVGRVRGGMTVYELDDTVTGTMFSSIPVNFPLPP